MARPKKQTVESQGFGDTIEKITEATGIKKAVELFSSITGIDCGCDERKEILNKIFPYKKPKCLNEVDYNYLKEFFESNPNTVNPMQQRQLSSVYFNVFSIQLEATSCSSCWRDYVGQLRQIYNQY